MSTSSVQRLATLQTSLIKAILPAARNCPQKIDDEEYYRRQPHPLLSPPGWHLGHCVYVECLWIRSTLFGDCGLERCLRDLYSPELVPKGDRGEILPPREELVDWAERLMEEHRGMLKMAPPGAARERMMQDDYLIYFLIHHHAQHLETLSMANAAWHAASPMDGYRVTSELSPDNSIISFQRLGSGRYHIGDDPGFSYDNELPRQQVELAAFDIAAKPVSNAQYLAFIQDGGYQTRNWWSGTGWMWLTRQNIRHPARWRRDAGGLWFEINSDGSADFIAKSPVHGVTRFEAGAFASWARARLPHEFEWEAAARAGILDKAGEVWEWCANTFHPYPGFGAYPYREYSVPWFDHRHFVLRGGCTHSEVEIKRPAFRNYYLADAGYLFAGIRLAK